MITDFGPVARRWTHENRISSDGNAMDVILEGLPEGARELFGKLAKVDGMMRLGGIFNYEPFLPGKKVTQDGFDQTQLYSSLHDLQIYLLKLGVDTQGILASRDGKPHPIAAHANATPDLNAWYSPQEDDLTFGTNNDKWHLASDSDVSIHEAGHLILDHINQTLGIWWDDDKKKIIIDEQTSTEWTRGEGGAIHEGFGDALAALLYNDAEMSEDFVPNIGRPGNKNDGLRIVDNNLTLDEVGTEVHDRGQVYAGFFWSIKKVLQDPNGLFKLSERDAADLTLKILFNHAANYNTSRPSPKDFVQAVLFGIDGLDFILQLGVDRETLKQFVRVEAGKRGMLKPVAEDEGEYLVFGNFNPIARRFGNNFKLLQKAPFLGGSQEIYQQYHKLSNGQNVSLEGRVLFVNKDARGKVISVSARDAAELKNIKVDETVKVNPMTAAKNAYLDAQKRLAAAKMQMLGFGRQSLKAIAEKQMNFKIFEAAMQTLSRRPLGNQDKPRMVIIPGSNELHYEIKVGMGVYYVNAKTGDTKFRKDVFVN